MGKIVIGNHGNHPVGFDLETLLRTRLLIQANSGGGKSYLLRRLAEQLFGKVQVILIDREGEFSTLRQKYGYLHVGDGGDTPADTRSARLLAEKILELRVSAVCDLFEAFRSRPLDRRAWLAAFLEALIDAPRSMWRDLVVIVDEAHQFCPQENPKVASMAERETVGRCKDAMIALATVGRKRGYCAIWATQRLAKLDKDATAELFNRLVGMTIEDVDVDRAADLMSVSKEDKAAFKLSLRNLDPGNFYAFGRAITKERTLIRIGPVETTHPAPGAQKQAAEPPPAPEAIRHLLPKLADLPKEVEAKAKTEADLRKELREVRAELAQAKKAQPAAPPAPKAAPAPKRVEVPVLKTEDLRRLEAESKRATVIAEMLTKVLPTMTERALRIKEAVFGAQKINDMKATWRPDKEGPPMVMPQIRINDSETVPTPPRRRDIYVGTQQAEEGGLTPAKLRILQALRDFQDAGKMTPDRKWVAARAGVSWKSSGFRNNLGTLRSTGMIIYHSDGVGLTAEGRQHTQPSNMDGVMLRQSCYTICDPAKQRIFKPLLDAPGQVYGREELAALAGVSPASSGYRNNLGALRSAGMIEYQDGGVKAAAWLYID